MALSIPGFFLKPRTLLVVYFLVTLIVSLQSILLFTHDFGGNVYPEYNNYIIFRNSFFHLAGGQNLYQAYPHEQWDLYKYSPTFALWMSIPAHLPDAAGLLAWNLCNSLAVFLALMLLPFSNRTRCLLLWFVLAELVTSMQSSQSNGIMTGLIIIAYACMQRGKMAMAALWLVAATFIKVYGAVGFCLFLFYPGKVKFMGHTILWTILLAAMPLLITPWHMLVWQYSNWCTMIMNDQSASYGLSVMGWLHTWFGMVQYKNVVSITGILLFCVPFMRLKLYSNEVYKLSLLAFILLWMVIFNHKAESPTYIIAVTGAGIWYFSSPRQLWRDVLIAVLFIFTCLSPTELFPPYVGEHFFRPYTIKAFPCIVLWCIVFTQIMMMHSKERRRDKMAFP